MNLDEIKGLAEARKTVQDKAKNAGYGSCTSVGFFTDAGKYVDDDNPQCHIGLRYFRAGKDQPRFILSSFMRKNSSYADKGVEKDEAVKLTLLTYLFRMLKEHPLWGKGILNKDAQDVYDNGWVFDTSIPKNLLCSSIFATRWASEFPNNCMAMKMLMDAGCDSDIAFVASTVLYGKEKEGTIAGSHPSGHMPCPDGAPKEFLENFLKGVVVDDGDVSYHDSPGYTGINRVFVKSADYRHDDKVIGPLIREAIGKAKGWEATADIFYTKEVWAEENRKALENGGYSFRKDKIKDVVKALMGLKKEILAA